MLLPKQIEFIVAITNGVHANLSNEVNNSECLNASYFLFHTHLPETYKSIGYKSVGLTSTKCGKLTRMK